MSTLLFLWLSLAVAALAMVFDWRKRTIPNWLTLGTLAVAPLAHAVGAWAATHDLSAAIHATESSALGGAICGLVPLLLWRLRMIGGGDVKLVAAIGAMVGPTLGLESTFYGFLFATSFIVLRLAWQGRFWGTLGNGLAQLVNPLLPKGRRLAMRHELGESLRFGPALCAGVALAIVMHGGVS